MSSETARWLIVALLAVVAIGVSASALDATLSTEPEDAIDVDYASIPIGKEDAANVRSEIERHTGDGESDNPSDASDPSSQPGDQPESGAAAEMDGEGDDAGTGAGDEAGMGAGDEAGTGAGGGTGSGSESEDSVLERLIELLVSVLRALIVVLLSVGAIGLAVRYRDRLFGLLDDDGSTSGTAGRRGPHAWLDGTPHNPVDQAWVDLVERLDLAEPEAMTPAECATTAVESGFDREAVETLTETFEEIRYGGRPVTPERIGRAWRSARRLTNGSEVR